MYLNQNFNGVCMWIFTKVMKTCEQGALSREVEWAHALHQQVTPLSDQWCMKLQPGSCNRHINLMGINHAIQALFRFGSVPLIHIRLAPLSLGFSYLSSSFSRITTMMSMCTLIAPIHYNLMMHSQQTKHSKVVSKFHYCICLAKTTIVGCS